MFKTFSGLLYQTMASEEYQVQVQSAFDVQWSAHKFEMGTLIHVNVFDGDHIDLNSIKALDQKMLSAYQSDAERLSKVAILNIVVGEGAFDFSDLDEYYGQNIYSVFWHVDLKEQRISVPKGQPKKLFGLQDLVYDAMKRTETEIPGAAFAETDDSLAATFEKKEIAKEVPKHKHAFLTYGIIVINIVVLLLMYRAGYPDDFWVPLRFGAIFPENIWVHGQWWRLGSAVFVHFGFAHLAANIMGLLIFGSRVERYFGRMVFLMVYVAAGLMGSLFSLFLSQAYAAGASGAVYGLVGALFIYTRITKRSIDMINWTTMFMFVVIGMVMGFAQTGIDNFAHLGGFIGGLAVGFIYTQYKPRNLNQ